MEFVMNPDDLAYAKEQASSHRTVQDFLDYFADGEAPQRELLSALYGIRDQFFDPEHFAEGISEQDREEADKAVLCIEVFVFAGLYSANKKRVPKGFVAVFHDLLPGCQDPYKINESHEIFCSPGGIAREWISEFDQRVIEENFCLHVTGPIYALAQAFVVAQEEEAAEETNRQDALAWEGKVSPFVLKSLDEALGGDDEESEARQ